MPQHFLSRFAGWMSHSRVPWLKRYLIQWFLKRYPVNLEEVVEPNVEAFPCYHEFFIRRLKPSARPIDPTPEGICSPCDGTISQGGQIQKGLLLQAKNRFFTLEALLGDTEYAKRFENGSFVTIYLAPQDYHRVHMPFSGTLEAMHFIPGKLFSVNPRTTLGVDNLFARNERVVSYFNSEMGPFAVVLVGAMLVGSIYTRWAGCVAPQSSKQIVRTSYPQQNSQYIKLDKGEEMGYFALGSTVIVLLARDMVWEYDLEQNSRLVVGQRIGRFLP